jgi:hypothetical protein
MLAEYDLSKAVRGKFPGRFSRDVRYVSIDPDVSEHFPGPDDVNAALRFLATNFSPAYLKEILKQPHRKKVKKAS